MTWPWSSKQSTPLRRAPKLYTICLLHDFGHDVEIPNVPEEDMEYIKKHLGRDEIYDLGGHTVNLQRFSFARYTEQDEQLRTTKTQAT